MYGVIHGDKAFELKIEVGGYVLIVRAGKREPEIIDPTYAGAEKMTHISITVWEGDDNVTKRFKRSYEIIDGAIALPYGAANQARCLLDVLHSVLSA